MSDYSLQDLALVTNHCVETLRRMAVAGRLPGAYRLGRKWRVNHEMIARLRGVE